MNDKVMFTLLIFFSSAAFPNVTHFFIKYAVCEGGSFVFHSQPSIVCYFLRRLLLSYGENEQPTM